VERFLNPFAQHRLLSISLNSVSKWNVRVQPSLEDYVELKRKLPEVLAFSLAALLRFYRIRLDPEGNASGLYNGIAYPVSDSQEVLNFFAPLAEMPYAEYVKTVLAKTEFWKKDLNTIPGLTAFVAEKLEQMDKIGIREAVKNIL